MVRKVNGIDSLALCPSHARVDCPYSLGDAESRLCNRFIFIFACVYCNVIFVDKCLILIKFKYYFLKAGLDQAQSTVIGKVFKNTHTHTKQQLDW